MSLGREALEPGEGATIRVASDELDITDTIGETSGAPGGVVTLAELLGRSWRGRVLARLASWLGARAALDARREYLLRVEALKARHRKREAQLINEVHKYKTAAEALTLERGALSDLHVRMTTRIAAETVAYRAAAQLHTQRDQESL